MLGEILLDFKLEVNFHDNLIANYMSKTLQYTFKY